MFIILIIKTQLREPLEILERPDTGPPSPQKSQLFDRFEKIIVFPNLIASYLIWVRPIGRPLDGERERIYMSYIIYT